ncbi:g1276 [Coccomyxa viridis]|uniref:G1276 protein n=1 Tax=Coccomyxa viridis TaxID=1274662 RepID=A0ABP1FHM0_9CHLO
MNSLHSTLQELPAWQLVGVSGLVTLAISLFVYGFHPIWRYRLRKIPGPTGAWLRGSLPEVLSHGPHIMYTEWGKKYGKVFKYFSGAQPVVVINDAELARLASLRLSTRHDFRGPASLFTGSEKAFNMSGLFSTNDKDFHRSAKASWLPVFNSASLEISSKEMNVGADRLAAILSRAANEGRELNIWRQFGHMTMDVVGSAAFGVELRTQEAERGMNSEEAEKLVWAAQTIFATGSEKSSIYTYPAAVLPILNPLMKALAYLFPDKGIRSAIQARQVLRGTVGELVKETRKAEAEGGKKEQAPAVSVHANAAEGRKKPRGVQPGSFLSLMINSKHSNGEPFSDLLASSQAFTFLLAGYETTASALAFTVYCLAKSPQKMDKLVKELDAYGLDTFTPGDLPKLPYLEACLKEAMRLYPPGVFLIREPLTEDFHLQGYTIPKGTWIHLPVFTLQRDSKYFERPMEFIPERWVEGCPEEQSLNRHVPGSWMAFGEGTRVCVGQRFALVEAKITLAKLFRKFTFKLSPGQETDEALGLRSFFTLGPAEGIFVTPVQRHEE